MMQLYVFDENINLLGIIENYDSLRWLNEYNGLGEFQLMASSVDENVNLLKQGNILWKNDGQDSCIIEYVNIKNGEMEIRGKSSKKIIENRIILKTEVVKNIEIGFRNIINNNCLIPGSYNRTVKNLILGPINNLTDETNSQVTYDTITDYFKGYNSIGYKINLDIINKKHVFEVYKGKDLTLDIVFAEEFDNIVETTINNDSSKYKNVAIVGGRGEGADRRIRYLDRTLQGEDKRELWVDYKDIEIEDKDGKPFDEQTIEDMMRAKGDEKLAEQLDLKSFEAIIVANGNYTYKEDYNLGDIVTCKSSKYNIQLKVRITAIQEIYEESGYKIYATLGNI